MPKKVVCITSKKKYGAVYQLPKPLPLPPPPKLVA
jgi:hypothetical protein